METRLKAEEQARLKAGEQARLKTGEQAKMRDVQGEHKMRMKEEQKCLPEERCKRIYEQNQLLREEQEKCSDEDIEVPQAIEKVLVSKSEQVQTFIADPDAVAQPFAAEEEKDLSRDSSHVPLISAEDETYEEKEETLADVIKDKGDINPVILSKE
ncbi:hypothetical protein TNIN_221581 [Trichonephila inaurata madagascariensis]|uniref:Uncharacterized protein n=1 Tax=Trichonephila inaurata madagascariensis TaxID=2747483 RepID=A0A8X6M755_9ARAC|nr:hypothetical protein TNIN_221581 [Trichonephila inaurata madagascariensis]